MPVAKESARIQSLFAGISRRYDLLNHLLSFNVDRRWRRLTARALELRAGDRVLDACTGTADLALELCRGVDAARGGQVVGIDFCAEMVAVGERKRRRRGEERLRLAVADTLELPFARGSFDAAAVAFGIRNVCDLDRALAELARVLRPGGRCAILEFTTPRSRPVRGVYHAYFHHVLPRVGRWLSGSRNSGDAYSYLPQSVSEFPAPDAFAERLRAAGFSTVGYRLLTAGIAALHTGRRAPEVHGAPPARRLS